MPRPNDYPRWRFMTMQAVMWGVLLCTVGIAALASSYKRGASIVTLGDEPQVLDSVSVRLPDNWIIERRSDGLISASDDPEPTRVIEVREREVTWMNRIAATINSKGGKPKRLIPMGPITGQLREKRSRSGTGHQIFETEAIGTLKNGNVLSITILQLVENRRDETDAVELLTKIASSVQYANQ